MTENSFTTLKICLFAGTTEGRIFAEKLLEKSSAAADLTICVATEYGESLLEESGLKGAKIRAGRMDEAAMETIFQTERYHLVIDATHPYAAIVSENIKNAAANTGIEYLRIIRDINHSDQLKTSINNGLSNNTVTIDFSHNPELSGNSIFDNYILVSSAAEAAEYLKTTEGNILLTTGSKDLSAYEIIDSDRIWARVLPFPSSMECCDKAGILSSHIIAMQGPFTEEFNIALLKMIHAKYLVTKLTGKSGGFNEKLLAAEKTSAKVILIAPPHEDSGLTLQQAIEYLKL